MARKGKPEKSKRRPKQVRQYPMRNKHHLTPKGRRGDNERSNILLLHIAKHEAWHTIFGNRTLEEIITLLV